MKSVKLKSLYLLIVAVLVVLVTNSCRKDIHSSAPQIGHEQLIDAKSWYESNYPFKGKKINDIDDGIDFSQLIKPDWDNANSYERFGDEVLEIPEDATSSIGANINADSAVYKKDYSKSSFLLLKNNGTYQGFIMTIIGEAGYVGNNPTKLDSNRYNKRDEDFSGVVLYSTPTGRFVNGWLYKNGNITERLLPDQAVTGNTGNYSTVSKGKTKHKLRVDNYTTAVTYCTDWYQKIDGVWVYLDSFCHTTLIEVAGGGGSSSSGGGGGSSGGSGGPSTGTPQTTPCEPGPASVIKNKTGKLKTNGNAPANPGSGFPPPTTPPPCDELLVLPQNKLCSSTFVFKTIVQPNSAQGSRGWKEASVSKITINATADNYLENIWNTLTTGSGVATGVFNLEVGVPGDLPDHLITAETALAANITMVELEKSYGFSGLKTLINNGTLGAKVAQLMQIHLAAVIPGSRVSSQLSGRTVPNSPVTGINCK